MSVPIHPVAKADGLLGLNPGELIHAGFALFYKLVNAPKAVAGDEVFDVALRLQLQFFFNFDLDPESLAIEAVLKALIVAGHGEVALVGVLISSTPRVMDAHRIIGGNWPI